MITASSARWRFVLINGLTWLPRGIGFAVFVLLMQARGIDLAGVGLLLAVYGVTVAALELPTGGFADVMGRRAVLAVAAGFGIAASLGLAFATSFWQWVAVVVLLGINRALSSGPDEAWYVDTVHAIGDSGDELRRGLSQGRAGGLVGLMIGTLIGGTVPLVVPLPDTGLLVPLAVPMLLSAVAGGGLLAMVLFGMPEPSRAAHPRMGDVLRDVPATIRRGVGLGFRDGVLTRLLLTAGSLGVALNSIEMLTPGRLAQLTGDSTTAATAYAVVTGIGFGATALGSLLSPIVARWVGGANKAATSARTATVGAVVSAACLAGLAASTMLSGWVGIAATAAGYAGMGAGLGMTNPVRSELLHLRVASTERATLLSVDSLLLQAGGLVSALGLGAVAELWSVGAAWTISASLLLASGGLFASRAVRQSADHPVSPGVEVHPAGTEEADKAHA